MIKFYLLKRSLLVVLLLGCLCVHAQTRITGKVTSADDGNALPGVSILEKGTSNGTVTDADGNFSIGVAQNATLVFSFVGFTSQEVPVSGQSAINVTLTPDVTSLTEVVVVGYGEVQKKDATGAVAVMSNRDFNKGVMSSPQDQIIGKFAGVSVTQNSGAPGAASTIRIRGGSSLTATNDPLIVIDGYPVDISNSTNYPGVANPLASLNPNDIESYTILKDASATAIYGSRAANGVIIITTKKGASGQKMQLNYNGNVSVSSPMKYLDVMNATQFKGLVDQLATAGTFAIDDAAKAKLGNANTDWQKEIFRNAISHDHNLSASGSVKNLPYRVSYGYTDQEGILKTTNTKRNSLNVNLNPTLLNGDLKLNLSAKGSYTNTNFGEPNAVGDAVSFDPTQPVMDGNSEYGGYFSWLSKGVLNGNANPVAELNQTDNTSIAKRIITNAQVEYKLPFAKGLKANLNLGMDETVSDGHNRVPHDAGFVHNNGTLVGRNNTYGARNWSKLLDFYLNYNREFGLHKIDATAGYGYQHFYRRGFNTTSNEASTTTLPFASQNFLVSFFGRLNYTYNGKYLLTATLRDDGSSRFSKKNRWGLFPSVALAWRLKDENFLSGVNALSDLKLRAGYGVTGQQDVPLAYYPYLATYRASNSLAQYQLGNTFYTTLRPEAYDANIRWEQTATVNLGLDFGFIDDRITGSVEVFQKNTTDLLNYVQIANGVNFSNYVTTNVGSMRNQGVELTLNGLVVAKPDFTWNVGVNFTSINSKITKLNLTDDPTYPGVPTGNIGVGAFIQNQQVGHPINSFLTYQQVYENGKPVEGLYVDRSGQGGTVVGNVANKYYDGKPTPKFLAGLNTRMRYHQVDFSFSSRLSIGNHVYNNVEAGRAFYNGVYQLQHFRNVPNFITDAGFVSQQQYSDYYVQNASFFKMDNISAGYNFDHVFTDKVKARLSLTVQNAFFVTKYKGLDPEVDGSPSGTGIDNNLYPRPRTFLLGLNLTF